MDENQLYFKNFSKLAREFTAIKSVSDNKDELDRAIDFCKMLISQSIYYVVREFESNGKKSLVATYKGIKNPEVFLHGHVDVVPAPDSLFNLQERNNKYLGRGTVDMKLPLIIYIFALNQLPEDIAKKVGLMIVSDEETGGEDGVGMLRNKGYIPKFFVTGEPTDMEIYTQAKGLLWLEITSRGVSAHSGAPWLGENAIIQMHKNITKLLQKKPIPTRYTWDTTFSVTKIEGGDTLNAIPDICKLYLDIRYAPEESPKDILRIVQNVFPTSQARIIRRNDPIVNNEKDPYIQKLAKTFNVVSKKKAKFSKNLGSTDARFYSAIGVPAVSFGPAGGNAHSEKEWLDRMSLFQYKKIIQDFLSSLI